MYPGSASIVISFPLHKEISLEPSNAPIDVDKLIAGGLALRFIGIVEDGALDDTAPSGSV